MGRWRYSLGSIVLIYTQWWLTCSDTGWVNYVFSPASLEPGFFWMEYTLEFVQEVVNSVTEHWELDIQLYLDQSRLKPGWSIGW